MGDKLLSVKLQKDILRALSIFHPRPMTAKQYLSCFDDVNEFVMLINISELIRRDLIHPEAIRYCDDEPFLCVGRLRLQAKGLEVATREYHHGAVKQPQSDSLRNS